MSDKQKETKKLKEVPGQVDEIVMPRGTPLGLCDSAGTEFCVGSVVRRDTDINKTVYGSWVDYEVTLQGTTPLLSYLRSETGQALPIGHTACCLCNEYDHLMFVFVTDSKSLRPDGNLIIQEEEQCSKRTRRA